MAVPHLHGCVRFFHLHLSIYLSIYVCLSHTHTHICILYIHIHKHCTGRDTPSPWSDLSAAQRHTVTHTLALHKHMHMQTCRHTLQKSILINAGLALNTEGGGLSKPLISPLAVFSFLFRVYACLGVCVHVCACERHGSGRVNSVTAVSGFRRRARTHVFFPRCEGRSFGSAKRWCHTDPEWLAKCLMWHEWEAIRGQAGGAGGGHGAHPACSCLLSTLLHADAVRRMEEQKRISGDFTCSVVSHGVGPWS